MKSLAIVIDDRHAGGRTPISQVHRRQEEPAHVLPRSERKARHMAADSPHQESDSPLEPTTDIDDD